MTYKQSSHFKISRQIISTAKTAN